LGVVVLGLGQKVEDGVVLRRENSWHREGKPEQNDCLLPFIELMSTSYRDEIATHSYIN
jgi:hypothetical protein